MEDAVMFNQAFEYDAYRTRFEDEVRTLGVVEAFNDRYIYLTATLREDGVNVDWLGHGAFTGVELDHEALNDALLTAGVPTPLGDGQFNVVQAAYNEVAGTFFRNAWDAEDYDGVYMDDEFLYFFLDEPSYERLREQAEDIGDRYERRVDSDRFDPKLDNGEALTPQQIANLDVIQDILPKGIDVPDEDGSLLYTGQLVETEPIQEYRYDALEVYLHGLMPIEVAEAYVLREDSGVERAREVFGKEDADKLLAKADSYIRQARWMVENAEASQEQES